MTEEAQVLAVDGGMPERTPTPYVPTLRRTPQAMLEQVPRRYRVIYTEMEAKVMGMDHEVFCIREHLTSSNRALESIRAKLDDSKSRYTRLDELHRTRCKECPGKCSDPDDVEWVRRSLEDLEGQVGAREREVEELERMVEAFEKKNAWAKKELEKLWIEMVKEGNKKKCLQYGCLPS